MRLITCTCNYSKVCQLYYWKVQNIQTVSEKEWNLETRKKI